VLALGLGCRGPSSGSTSSAGSAERWRNRLAPGPRPNVLFVVYDARRADDFSFGPRGNRRADTPFLAGFVRESASFSAVSPGTWTVPVHASMFSGLSVCELGDGVFSLEWASFPTGFLSLAEILAAAGYRTVMFADHPFFYGLNVRHGEDRSYSLLRGFQLFSVVNDFGRFGVHTNIGTEGGKVELAHTLAGPPASVAEAAADVERFNAGRLRVNPARDGDEDTERQVLLARLWPLFERSSYLRRRYVDAFDRYVFAPGASQPWFLFLNLHMATEIAEPDPELYARWCIRTLMLNATARGRRLPRVTEPLKQWVTTAFSELGLRHDRFPTAGVYLKQVFDNRFYDASFEGVWRYLQARGLVSNTVTVVASDHGMSFSEKGETFYHHAGCRPYEYITRVPLVIRFPAGSELARFHRRYEERVSLTDVFSTILDVSLGAGVFTRDLPIRGRSLVARMRENAFDPVQVTEATVAPDNYPSEPDAAGEAKAVYWLRYKLILMPDPRRVTDRNWPRNFPIDRPIPGAPGATENPRLGRQLAWLYDIEADPQERDDLAPTHPEMVAAMKRLVGNWSCRPLDSSPRGRPTPQFDPDALETLRALGYVE
jgi:arylsulfatase A-like enzyme